MIYDSRLAEYLYHVELPNSAARGAAVMPSSTNLPTNMLSVSIGAHKYATCFYWSPTSSYLCAQQHKFTHKYVECFYWRPQICCMFLLAPTVRLSLCPAAQIYTQICWVFLLAPTNMLHVSIGAHRQVFFVLSHKFRQIYGEPSYWMEQQHGFAWKFVSLVRM